MLRFRKPLLPEWRWWPAVFLAALFALAVYGISLSPQPTKQSYQDPKSDEAKNNPLTDFGHWVTKDSISFFTFVLAVVAVGQGILIFLQIRLGRQEFIASHRPRLAIREPFIESSILQGEAGQFIEIVYLLENCGDSTAHIIAATLEARYWENGAPGLPASTEQNDIGFVSLVPGQDRRLIAKTNLRFQKRFLLGNLRSETTLYFVGRIVFADDLRINRQMAFCRQYNSKGGRFCLIPGSEDEYGG
jgi:hypothetical protein